MNVVDRRLVVVIALAALATLAAAAPHAAPAGRVSAPLEELAPRLPGWTAVAGASDDVLPDDARAVERLRRTYTNGARQVWLTIARYDPRNDPQRRPALERIVRERGASGVLREHRTVTLADGGGERVVSQLSVERPDEQARVVYWYQLGTAAIAGDYRLRAALFIQTLRGRSDDLLLIRLGTTGADVPDTLLRATLGQLVSRSDDTNAASSTSPRQGRGHGE